MVARKKAKPAKAGAQKFNVVDSAQQIWLAGLGALSRAQHDGPKLFKTLVTEGGKVQDRTSKTVEQAIKTTVKNIQGTVGERVSEVKGKAQDTWDNVEKIFQSRVQKAIHELGVPSSREINALSRKVDELTRSVEKLSSMRAPRHTAPRARAVRTSALDEHSAGGPIA